MTVGQRILFIIFVLPPSFLLVALVVGFIFDSVTSVVGQ